MQRQVLNEQYLVQITKKEFMKTQEMTKQIAFFVFGVIVPLIILFQAYHGASSLVENISEGSGRKDLVGVFKNIQPSMKATNDYALFS
jgi:hypothetical protein